MTSEEKIYTNCRNYDTPSCPHLGNDAFRIPKDFHPKGKINVPIITVESDQGGKKLCGECQSFKRDRP